jgi:predicted component of type VI protein secretion system
MNKLVTFIAVGICASLLSGCATPAKPSAMVPTALAATKHHPGSVSVAVTGGKKTNPNWKSDVSSEDFSTALVTALNQSALFSSVVDANSDYRLEVQLVRVMPPTGEFTLSSTVVSEWQLIRVRDSAVVSDEYITTPFSATVGEAFAGMTRARKAVEGAARANIAEGIRRLSELNLEK